MYKYDESKEFQLICLMKKEKYDSLPIVNREALESLGLNGVEVLDVRVKSPNNPVKLMEAKMLAFKV